MNDYEKVCNFCTVCIVLFVMILIISTIISSVFIYFHWCLFSKDNIHIKFNTILKQQFIECNSIRHINGECKGNKQ